MNRREAKEAGAGNGRLAPRGEIGGARSNAVGSRGIASRPPGAGAGGGERVIRYKTCLRNTIGDVLRSRGWQEAREGESDWDFYWCDVAWMREHFDQTYLEEHQRICHFRNHYELTRSAKSLAYYSPVPKIYS